jgi:hypothetical protein
MSWGQVRTCGAPRQAQAGCSPGASPFDALPGAFGVHPRGMPWPRAHAPPAVECGAHAGPAACIRGSTPRPRAQAEVAVHRKLPHAGAGPGPSPCKGNGARLGPGARTGSCSAGSWRPPNRLVHEVVARREVARPPAVSAYRPFRPRQPLRPGLVSINGCLPAPSLRSVVGPLHLSLPSPGLRGPPDGGPAGDGGETAAGGPDWVHLPRRAPRRGDIAVRAARRWGDPLSHPASGLAGSALTSAALRRREAST